MFQIPTQRLLVATGHTWPDRGRLRISVVAGTGEGHTPLSAFDAALWQCDIHNYNLIRLSSVIPAASDVEVCGRYEAPAMEYGHKLYAVKTDVRSAKPGTAIAAGLGWLQSDDGRGLFVEYEAIARHGTCTTVERATADEIVASLEDLAVIRGLKFSIEQVRMHVVSTRVETRPACALVVAVYQAEGWHERLPLVARAAQ